MTGGTPGPLPLWLAAVHAVAPELVGAEEVARAGEPDAVSAEEVIAAVRADARASQIAARLTGEEGERVRRVVEGMCLGLAHDFEAAARRFA